VVNAFDRSGSGARGWIDARLVLIAAALAFAGAAVTQATLSVSPRATGANLPAPAVTTL
jgi:hypothetical protein